MKVIFLFTIFLIGNPSILLASNTGIEVDKIDEIYKKATELIDQNGYTEQACNLLEELSKDEYYKLLQTPQLITVANFLIDRQQYEKAAQGFIKIFQERKIPGDTRSYFNAIGVETKISLVKMMMDPQQAEKATNVLKNYWQKNVELLDSLIKNTEKEKLKEDYKEEFEQFCRKQKNDKALTGLNLDNEAIDEIDKLAKFHNVILSDLFSVEEINKVRACAIKNREVLIVKVTAKGLGYKDEEIACTYRPQNSSDLTICSILKHIKSDISFGNMFTEHHKVHVNVTLDTSNRNFYQENKEDFDEQKQLGLTKSFIDCRTVN